MGDPLALLALDLLYWMDASGRDDGDGVDGDQVLHWMVRISEAIGDLDDEQAARFQETAREAASLAEAAGDRDKAEAFLRLAEG